MTAEEIKFALDRRLIEKECRIAGVHSIFVDGDVAHLGFDIVPGDDHDVLFVEFKMPAPLSRDELAEFANWLASSGCRTFH